MILHLSQFLQWHHQKKCLESGIAIAAVMILMIVVISVYTGNSTWLRDSVWSGDFKYWLWLCGGDSDCSGDPDCIGDSDCSGDPDCIGDPDCRGDPDCGGDPAGGD